MKTLKVIIKYIFCTIINSLEFLFRIMCVLSILAYYTNENNISKFTLLYVFLGGLIFSFWPLKRITIM